MKWLSFCFKAFLFSYLALFSNQELLSQEKRTSFFVNSDYFVLRGNVVSTGTMADLEISPLLTFLSQESLQVELELVQSQKVELKKRLEKAAKVRRKAFELRKSGELDQAISVLEDSKEEFNTWAHEILLPHQIDSMNKITSRIKMRKAGIERFLKAAPFELSPKEVTAVNQVLRKKREAVKIRVAKLKNKTVDEILRSLPKTKKDAVLNKYGKAKTKVALFHLLAQMEYISSLKKLRPQAKLDSGFDAIKFSSQYTMNPDGSFSFRRTDETSKTLSVYSIVRTIQYSPNFPTHIRREVEDLAASKQERRRENRKVRNKVSESGDREIAYAEYRQKEAKLQRELRRECERLIEGHEEVFLATCLASNVAANGLLVELVDGSVGQQFALSIDDREKLKDRIEVEFKKLLDEVVKIESEILKDIKDPFRQESGRALLALRMATKKMLSIFVHVDSA